MSKNQEILLTNSAVDFLKDKIGGGSGALYQHNILVEEFVQAQVLTTSATPFTLATFIQWLGNNQYPCNGMAHEMSEDGIYGNTLYLFVDNNLLTAHLYDKPDSGNVWTYNFNNNVDLVFDDTVIQIQ